MVLLLLLTTSLSLSPVLFADFIRLDDYAHIIENPQLRSMSVSGLAGSWTRPYFGLYVPITYSAWWALTLIGSLFGELERNAWLFHAFNLALHLANATLVFGIVRTLTRLGRRETTPADGARDDSIALTSALLFSLHPMQVESVAWVSEMKGELAAMFGFLGIWWHYRSSKRVLVAVFFVAAMLSKPTALVFPVLVFLIDRIVLRKRLAESAVTPVLGGVPLLMLAVVTRTLQPDSDQDFIPTVFQRLIVAADALAFYLPKVLVPLSLAVDYGRPPQQVLEHSSRLWLVSSALVAVAGIAVVIRALIRRRSPARTGHWQLLTYCGWAIFVVSMVPVLGLIPFEFQYLSTVTDRYLYVPMFGVSMMVSGILIRCGASVTSRWISAVLLVVCAALGFQQARLWRSTQSLFANTMAVNPRSYLAPFCIGEDLMRSGRLDEAIDWLQRSLAINPNYTSAVLNLGTAFTRKGELGKAIEIYEAALAKNPSIVGARARPVASLHNNLGLALAQSGQEGIGVAHLRKAVEIFPGSLNAHVNLGNFALENQRYADAVAEYETALSLSPGNGSIAQRLELAREGARQQQRAERGGP